MFQSEHDALPVVKTRYHAIHVQTTQFVSDMQFTRDKVRAMFQKISKMGTQEHEYLFDLVRYDTDTYTVNENGVFIPACKLSPSTMHRIDEFISLWEQDRRSASANREAGTTSFLQDLCSRR